MSLWIIEPRDPLIVRDGRPFDVAPGARSVSLPFPLPPAIVGATRTRSVVCARGVFPPNDQATVDLVRTLAVRGPLPVEIEDATAQEARVHLLAPAPADALLLNKLNDDDALPARRKQLAPVEPPPGAWADGECPLIGLLKPDAQPSKPFSPAPRFWHWKEFLNWLQAPEAETPLDPGVLGHAGPPPETRTHVSIDGAGRTHRDSALFQTRGLRFTRATPTGDFVRLGLAVEVGTLPGDLRLEPGCAPLGGERRLVFWRRGILSRDNTPSAENLEETNADATPGLSCPPELRAAIARTAGCRIVLLTPGAFAAGWKPTWLFEACDGGVTLQFAGAALGRAQTISGWDFQNDTPKPSRRLVPAGSVFFVKFDAKSSVAAREAWVDDLWLQAISDNEQDRLDGLGVAALGVWDGQTAPMEFAEPAEDLAT